MCPPERVIVAVCVHTALFQTFLRCAAVCIENKFPKLNVEAHLNLQHSRPSRASNSLPIDAWMTFSPLSQRTRQDIIPHFQIWWYIFHVAQNVQVFTRSHDSCSVRAHSTFSETFAVCWGFRWTHSRWAARILNCSHKKIEKLFWQSMQTKVCPPSLESLIIFCSQLL